MSKDVVRPERVAEMNQAIDTVRGLLLELNDAEKDYLMCNSLGYHRLVETVRRFYGGTRESMTRLDATRLLDAAEATEEKQSGQS